MKRVKLINDPAELVALFRAVDSKERRDVLTTLAEGWTMISDLVSKHGEGAYDAIIYSKHYPCGEYFIILFLAGRNIFLLHGQSPVNEVLRV